MPQREDQRTARRALDAANFFLADVRDGLGPYLAIYLLTEQKWDEARTSFANLLDSLDVRIDQARHDLRRPSKS